MPYSEIEKRRESNRRSYYKNIDKRHQYQRLHSKTPEAKEKRNKRRREKYLTDKGKILERNKTYNIKFKNKHGFSVSTFQNRRMKNNIINALGNKCANPFNIDHSSFEQLPEYFQVIQIDHIHAGGQKEINKFGAGTLTYYKFIFNKIKAGSKDYQLLCPTCNWIKRVINNELEIKK